MKVRQGNRLLHLLALQKRMQRLSELSLLLNTQNKKHRTVLCNITQMPQDHFTLKLISGAFCHLNLSVANSP